MIIVQRSNSLSYGTDSVATSVRATIAARAIVPAVRPETDGTSPAALDFDRLYPHLIDTPARVVSIDRVIRAAGVRISIMGTTALMMFALIHH